MIRNKIVCSDSLLDLWRSPLALWITSYAAILFMLTLLWAYIVTGAKIAAAEPVKSKARSARKRIAGKSVT
ncbi:MAG: hypothetical protein ABIJ39_12455 [Chloroflexota bacterium]